MSGKPTREGEEVAKIAGEQRAVENDVAGCKWFLCDLHLDKDEEDEQRNAETDRNDCDLRLP